MVTIYRKTQHIVTTAEFDSLLEAIRAYDDGNPSTNAIFEEHGGENWEPTEDLLHDLVWHDAVEARITITP
jgi:hypothetical protein